jgi:hypothetical protein
MSRYDKRLRGVVGEIAKTSDRSPLFWWLVENHDEIASAARGRRLRWDALCTRFAEAGLTDCNGKAPSPATARRTWHKARYMVAEERARQEAEAAKPKRVGARPPSRMPRDCRPEEVIVTAPPAASTPQTAARVAVAEGPTGPTTAGEPVGCTKPWEAELKAKEERAFEEYFRDYMTRGKIPAELWEQFRPSTRRTWEMTKHTRIME